MDSSPTVVMRSGNRGRRAVMGALFVAALLGLGALLLPNGAYVLQVDALDDQENLGQASFAFTVRN